MEDNALDTVEVLACLNEAISPYTCDIEWLEKGQKARIFFKNTSGVPIFSVVEERFNILRYPRNIRRFADAMLSWLRADS